MTLISHRRCSGLLGICSLVLGIDMAVGSPMAGQASLIEEAAAYRMAGQVDRAIATYQEALDAEPDLESGYLGLAEIFVEAGRDREAEDVLEQGLDQRPDSRSLHVELAELHFRAGRASEALALFEAASELDGGPDMDVATDTRFRSAIHQRIGDMHTYLIGFDDALASYDRAIAIDPDNLEARLVMANVNLRRNRLERAAAGYREILVRNANYVPALYGVARTYLALGQFTEATAAAREVQRFDPTHVGASYVLARALIQGGHASEGEAALAAYQELELAARRAETRERRIQTIAASAVAALIDGEYDRAILILRNGIETVPDSHELYMDLGLTQNHLGLYQEAIKTFLTAIEMGLDSDPLLHNSLAEAYDATGNSGEAHRHRRIFTERQAVDVNR